MHLQLVTYIQYIPFIHIRDQTKGLTSAASPTNISARSSLSSTLSLAPHRPVSAQIVGNRNVNKALARKNDRYTSLGEEEDGDGDGYGGSGGVEMGRIGGSSKEDDADNEEDDNEEEGGGDETTRLLA